MTYRYAIWPPSEAWRSGYLFGAAVSDFKAAFPAKVKELGPPLRVWDSVSESSQRETAG